MTEPKTIMVRNLFRGAMVLVLLVGDLLALALALMVGFFLASWSSGGLDLAPFLQAVHFLAIFPVVLAGWGLYQRVSWNPAEEFRRLTLAALTFFAVALAGAVFAKRADAMSRSFLLVSLVCVAVLLPVLRSFMRYCMSRWSWCGESVAILGAGRTGELVARQLTARPWLGLRPMLFLDDQIPPGTLVAGLRVEGSLDLASEVLNRKGIHHAIVAMPGATGDQLRALDERIGTVFPCVTLIPPFIGFSSLWVEPRDLGGILGLQVKQRLLQPGARLMKGLLEWLVVVVLLVPVLVVGALVALWVKCDSRGPVFYTQERVGLNGRRFTVFKFRTMHGDGEERLQSLLDGDPALAAEYALTHKLRHDPRVTRAGRILRRTSLDELAQFINVLCGDLSVVGPRAYLPREMDRVAESARLILRVRPGVTGLWQVSGRNRLTFEERVAIDVGYVRNWSPWLDLWILGRTVEVVLFGRGAY